MKQADTFETLGIIKLPEHRLSWANLFFWALNAHNYFPISCALSLYA
jgi:hypothetical protein